MATAGSPEDVALKDFQTWSQFPSRNLRAKSVLNDGSFARVEVCAEVRHGYTDVWEEFSGEYSLAFVNGRWTIKDDPLYGIDQLLPVVAAATQQAASRARAQQLSAALAARSAIQADLTSVNRTKDPTFELYYWTADFKLHSSDGQQHTVVISPSFTGTMTQCAAKVSRLEGTDAMFSVSFAFGTKPRQTVGPEGAIYQYKMDAVSVTPLLGIDLCETVSNLRDLKLNFEEVDGVNAFSLDLTEHQQPRMTLVPPGTPVPVVASPKVPTPATEVSTNVHTEHSILLEGQALVFAACSAVIGGFGLWLLRRRRSTGARKKPLRAVRDLPTTSMTTVEPVSGAQGLTKPQAPLQVKCFGAAQVVAGGRVLWPSGEFSNEQRAWELLLFLAVSDPEGVDRDAVGAALWREADLADVGGSLRHLRRRLRAMLKRAVPGLPETAPFRADAGRMYRLDTSIVCSDAHRFLALQQRAKADESERLGLLEQALAMNEGDLFDSPAAPPFGWLLDPGEDGTSLRQVYRQQYLRIVGRWRIFTPREVLKPLAIGQSICTGGWGRRIQ